MPNTSFTANALSSIGIEGAMENERKKAIHSIGLDNHPDSFTYDFTDYVEACGNFFGKFYYIAVRLRKEVAFLKKISDSCVTLDPPKGVAVVIESDIPLHVLPATSLVFKMYPSKPHEKDFVSAVKEETLMLKMFPEGSIVHHVCVEKTLYVLSTRNPFRKCWKKIPRDTTFKALARMTMAMQNSPVDLEDCILLRLFKKDQVKKDFKKWSSWYHFLHRLSFNSFKKCVGSEPSSELADTLLGAISRTEGLIVPRLLDPDFYKCEITLDENAFTGVLFRIGSHSHVDYVSPMITTELTQYFLDVNRERCNGWLPLYQSKDTWTTKGFKRFCADFSKNCTLLRQVVCWLSIQTLEKYSKILRDLKLVQTIVEENQECYDLL